MTDRKEIKKDKLIESFTTASSNVSVIEKDNGDKEWRLNGELHREGAPAIVCMDGGESWFQHGKLHREDGPAVIKENGDEQWCLNGVFHRIGGPAISCEDGYREWRVNGKLHRKDGPAVENDDGFQLWYLNGKELGEKTITALMEKKKNTDIRRRILGIKV